MPDGYPEVDLLFWWGPRPLPLKRCARDWIRLLKAVAECVPQLDSWESVRSLSVIEPTLTAFEDELREGSHYNDDGELMPELGYSVSIQSTTHDWCSISVYCGASSKVAPNSCVIDLGKYRRCDPEIVGRVNWLKLFKKAIAVWRPDSAALHSKDSKRLDLEPIDFGWLTYLASCDQSIPDLPQGVCKRSVGRSGVLIDALPKNILGSTENEVDVLLDTHKRLKSCLQT